MGLRMVKKSVNQDDPTVYLFYGDEHAQPGLRPDLLRVPRRRSRSSGAAWSIASCGEVGSPAALDFWAERLAGEGIEAVRRGPALPRRSRGPRATSCW